MVAPFPFNSGTAALALAAAMHRTGYDIFAGSCDLSTVSRIASSRVMVDLISPLAMSAKLTDRLMDMADLAGMIDATLPKPGLRGPYRPRALEHSNPSSTVRAFSLVVSI
jgi:hypothetical protein